MITDLYSKWSEYEYIPLLDLSDGMLAVQVRLGLSVWFNHQLYHVISENPHSFSISHRTHEKDILEDG